MSLDLQEATRRDDAFNQLLVINEQITNLSLFPSLGWVWTFDIIKDIFENTDTGYDETIREGVTLKQIFDKFYEDIEILNETIRDWMRENDFIVALDEDGWLE